MKEKLSILRKFVVLSALLAALVWAVYDTNQTAVSASGCCSPCDEIDWSEVCPPGVPFPQCGPWRACYRNCDPTC